MSRTNHANVYALDRHYGGPEEGGWWYTSFTPRASVPCGPSWAARAVLALLKGQPRFAVDPDGYPLASVLHAGDGPDSLCFVVEAHRAEQEPTERPRYE